MKSLYRIEQKALDSIEQKAFEYPEKMFQVTEQIRVLNALPFLDAEQKTQLSRLETERRDLRADRLLIKAIGISKQIRALTALPTLDGEQKARLAGLAEQRRSLIAEWELLAGQRPDPFVELRRLLRAAR